MTETQQKIEESIRAKGYTIDNPNVILNPYGNSPLTALIAFETDKETDITVTIKGKDKLSTFEHTFASAKEHYLPIYGLYADYNNEVILTYSVEDKKESKTVEIQTDKLPDNMILPTSVKAEKKSLTTIYIFIHHPV